MLTLKMERLKHVRWWTGSQEQNGGCGLENEPGCGDRVVFQQFTVLFVGVHIVELETSGREKEYMIARCPYDAGDFALVPARLLVLFAGRLAILKIDEAHRFLTTLHSKNVEIWWEFNWDYITFVFQVEFGTKIQARSFHRHTVDASLLDHEDLNFVD